MNDDTRSNLRKQRRKTRSIGDVADMIRDIRVPMSVRSAGQDVKRRTSDGWVVSKGGYDVVALKSVSHQSPKRCLDPLELWM